MGKGEINIIKASAGSGKTYTLARTYITNLIGVPLEDKEGNTIQGKYKIRERNDYFHHILAITFTNKATNEMKDRIIKQLFALSQGEGDYIDFFKNHFVYDDFNQVIEAARKTLFEILFNYGSFNVSTIDSFFQTILRNFARELDRDYNYELQIDEEYATSVAVHDFMLELGGERADQKAIDNWVKDFIINNISQNKTWDFFGNAKNLEDFARNIYKEFFREHHDDIVKYLEDIGNGKQLSRIAQFKKCVIDARNYHEKQLNASPERYREFFGSKGMGEECLKKNAVKTIFLGHIENISSTTFNGTFRNYTNNEEVLVDNILLKKYQPLVNQSDCEEFHKLINETMHHWDMTNFYKSIIDNIWNLGMLGKIDEKLEQYRKDTNSILITDTNDLIGKVLECGATFIYEHAGTKFHNYMIDEFQDTSRKQYQNFTPLLKESCDTGNSNLIIGDEKQSIYRFRNSDPGLLRDELEIDFKRFARNNPLDTNYRSHPTIVNFNNEFFKQVVSTFCPNEEQLPSLKKTYRNINQKLNAKEKIGFVCLNCIPSSSKAGENKQQVLQCLPYYINSLRDRGYKMKDIAILVNRNSEGNEIVEHILQYNENLATDDDPHHINVVSNESLLLKNSPSVRLIISMLNFLEATQYRITSPNKDAEEDVSFNRFLNNRISQQKHYKVLHEFQAKMQNTSIEVNPGELLKECFAGDLANEQLSPAEKLDTYSTATQEVMPDKSCQLTNLVNIIDNIISKYILPKNGNSKVENSFILAFMSIVHEFTKQRNGGTIKEFLDFWETKKDKLAVSSPSSSDAINIMTIHKAKGLEFKCVIIPFANWELDKDDDLVWISKDEWLKRNSTGKPIGGIGEEDPDILPPLIPVSRAKTDVTKLFERQILDEKERCLIDNLNKLYVAFTRPEDELHVFSIDKGGSSVLPGNIKKTNELLLRIIPNLVNDDISITEHQLQLRINDRIEEGEEDEQQSLLTITSYQAGKLTTLEENKVQERKEAQSKLLKSNRIVSNVMPDYRKGDKIMPVHVKVNDTTTYSNEGIKMHDIFSKISSQTYFDNALQYAIANGLFTGNKYWTKERFLKLIDTIKANEDISSWFDDSNEVLNERTISLKTTGEDGEPVFNHYRPDRVIIRPNGDIQVIDYKFGYKNDPTTVNAHSARVREYMKLLKLLLGDSHEIKGYLWYTRHHAIVSVR